jgi:hypothetical protein
MNGLLLGWFTAFLIGLSVVLMLIIAVVLLPRAMGIRMARFYCPWKRRDVTMRYVTHDGEHPVSVVSCTAFADPSVVTCGAPCISETGKAQVAAGGRATDNLSGPRVVTGAPSPDGSSVARTTPAPS